MMINILVKLIEFYTKKLEENLNHPDDGFSELIENKEIFKQFKFTYTHITHRQLVFAERMTDRQFETHWFGEVAF